MEKSQDIGKIFLETFLKQILREVIIKNRYLEKKRMEDIKEKINIYESKNDFFDNEVNIPVPKPPVAPKIEEAPDKCKLKIAKSTAGPE